MKPKKKKKAEIALETIEYELSTPTKLKYSQRINEGYDVEGTSPCFDIYRKINLKSERGTNAQKDTSSENDTHLLAAAACMNDMP
jgi:hypothetical protein